MTASLETVKADRRFHEARQDRIDRAARAALAGMLASVDEADSRSVDNPARASAWAYDFGEAMEAERARRLK